MLHSILSSISLMALNGDMNPLAAHQSYSCVGVTLLFSLLVVFQNYLTKIVAQCICNTIVYNYESFICTGCQSIFLFVICAIPFICKAKMPIRFHLLIMPLPACSMSMFPGEVFDNFPFCIPRFEYDSSFI